MMVNKYVNIYHAWILRAIWATSLICMTIIQNAQMQMDKIEASQTIHVWYIYLHLPLKNKPHVGKYTIPMDGIGYVGLLPLWLSFV